MDAVILINKPKGITSFQAVSACRKAFGERKTGHTGTLDPNAEGLLIVLLGRYTKLTPYCVSDHKHYTAEFSFGRLTDTGDIWGTVIDEKPVRDIYDEELNTAAASLTGDIMQVPPMYSAIKINGRKLYEYARKGESIDRKPRPVHISSIHVCRTGENRYRMEAVVSSGTYIRTLIEDLAEKLGMYGCMTALKRTQIEHLMLNQANEISDLAEHPVLISPLEVIDPRYELIEYSIPERIKNGRAVILNQAHSDTVILKNGNELLAAYQKKEDGLYHCLRGLF
ncbi:MAG: tRNA pseudouridine(55) synthase TruB [Solobacterium sp.]|nr:tRNA pseudouridine(55) synthase TruB [Solobacterium sp.]